VCKARVGGREVHIEGATFDLVRSDPKIVGWFVAQGLTNVLVEAEVSRNKYGHILGMRDFHYERP